MGKIRKSLAILFGCLSVVFAAVALRNTLLKCENGSKFASVSECAWNDCVEASARKEGKLVFLKLKGLNVFPLSGNAEKILKRNYISTEISPETNPADYSILNYILETATKRKCHFEAGIFSPNLIPIYMTSETAMRGGHFAPNLENAIIGAAAQFEKSPDTLKSTARAAARIADAPSDFSISLDNFRMSGCLRFLNSESARLFIYFNTARTLNEDAAVLSENARLAARIGNADIRQMAARSAAASAAEMLCARVSSKSENSTSKLLFLRALGESEYALKNDKINSFFMFFAESIADAKKRKQILGEAEFPLVRDCALSVPILLRAFDFTGDERYYKCAEKTAETLASALAGRGPMPSVLGKESEASALEYVLCARAFFEMSKTSGEKKWLKHSRRALLELDKHFMTDIGVWSVNSKDSALSKISRVVFTRDSEVPSYVGEAAQLFSEIGGASPATAQKLKKLALAAASTAPLMSHQWASLKLSLLPLFEADAERHRHGADTPTDPGKTAPRSAQTAYSLTFF